MPDIKLSLCLSTHDEYENAWNTINAALINDFDVIQEIVICDNSPANSAHAKLLKQHCGGRGREKLVYDRIVGPASACRYKDRAVRKSSGDYIVVCDTHVLFHKGALQSIVDYFTEFPETNDLLMGPCYNGATTCLGTNQMLYAHEGYPVPDTANVWEGVVMRGGTYGIWVHDQRVEDLDQPPFEIQQQGTGAMAFRKAAWPGVLPSFNGHGGTETWIMEKFRQNGGRVMLLPKFRWVHQWGRPGMATETKERLLAGIQQVADPALVKHLTSLVHDTERPTYGFSTGGTIQKAENTLTAAYDLGRTDLYDAAVLEFTRGGTNGKPLWPEACLRAQKKIPRPGLYSELMAEWERHGGRKSGAVPRALFQELEKQLRAKPHARVLEFGSGLSTLLFDRLGIHSTSIEDSEVWLNRLRGLLTQETTRLIYAPLADTASGPWYQWRPAEGETFDVILIDGPIGEGPTSPGRMAAKHFLADLMADECVVILDDTHREREQQLSQDLQEMYGLLQRRVICA